jgi:hypothetical protein
VTVQQRQGTGSCPDMIKCYKVDLISEKGEVG